MTAPAMVTQRDGEVGATLRATCSHPSDQARSGLGAPRFDQAQGALKPCPFCGAALSSSGCWAIHPDNDCVLSGGEYGDASKSDADSLALWNVRACNSHDDLLSALEKMVDAMGNRPTISVDAADAIARVAIAKACGGVA